MNGTSQSHLRFGKPAIPGSVWFRDPQLRQTITGLTVVMFNQDFITMDGKMRKAE